MKDEKLNNPREKQCNIHDVVCNALPDDYPNPEEIDKIDEDYRQAYWCPKCLAMFEEECVCDYDEYD